MHIQSNSTLNTEPKASCLVVEDEALCSYMTCMLLKELSCFTDLAKTAAQAYSFLQGKIYDIVFLDIGLPDKNGFELTKDIRDSLHLTIPIVAITGHIFKKDKGYFTDRGLNNVIYKPASLDDLQEVLSKEKIRTIR